jgi:hypothetical protein
MDRIDWVALFWASGIGLISLGYLAERTHAWWNGEDYPFRSLEPGDFSVAGFWPFMVVFGLLALILFGISCVTLGPIRHARNEHVKRLREKERLSSLGKTGP